MIKIDTHMFYNIGVWAFGIVALMNTFTFVLNVQLGVFTYPTMLVSSFASLVFNYALFGFFYWLRSNLPPKKIEIATDLEMEEILNENKKEGKNERV